MLYKWIFLSTERTSFILQIFRFLRFVESINFQIYDVIYDVIIDITAH